MSVAPEAGELSMEPRTGPAQAANASLSSSAATWVSAPPILLAVLLLAYALRLLGLGAQELRGDEAFGYFFLQAPYAQIVKDTIDLAEPHPVASYFVQKAWLSLAGTSEFAQRFSSAWFSVLAVALLYRWGRRLRLPWGAAALAAGLLAASPYAVWHSQDARMYSMLLALIVASCWLALEVVEHGGPVRWAAYLAVSWLALHTHYSALFVLFAQDLGIIAWLLATRRSSTLLRWLAGQAALAILYLPWILLIGRNLSAYSGNGDSPGIVAMVARSFSALGLGESIAGTLRSWLAALVIVLVAWGFVKLLRFSPEPWAAWWLAIYLLVPLGATWLTALNRPIFNERYLVAALPPFCLLVAAGVWPVASRVWVTEAEVGPRAHAVHEAPGAPAYLTAKWLSLVALPVLLAFTVVSLGNHYANPAYSKSHGWRSLASALAQLTRDIPADRVRIAENYPDPTLWYYYPVPVEHVVLPPGADDAGGARAEVARLADAGVTWVLLPVLPSEAWDPRGLASTALAERYVLAERRQVGSWPLEVYVRPDPGALHPVAAAFGNGVTIEAAQIEPGQVSPGGLVAVHVKWGGSGSGLHGSERAFIHVAGPDGAPIAQVDPSFDGAKPGTVATYGIPLPEGTAPGTYRVLAGLYDPAQPGSPRVTTAAGADHVVLGDLVVRRLAAP